MVARPDFSIDHWNIFLKPSSLSFPMVKSFLNFVVDQSICLLGESEIRKHNLTQESRLIRPSLIGLQENDPIIENNIQLQALVGAS